MTTARTALGFQGEEIERARLERAGMRFVGRNWHCPAGELDLIMDDGDELVFVEVKTRRTELAGSAEESVSPAKTRRLLAAAVSYLAEEDAPDRIWRIDLVAITLAKDGRLIRYTHLHNAIVSG